MIKLELQQRFKDLKGIIWDLDNTLYRIEEEYLNHFNLETAKTVVESGVPLSFENAAALAFESFRKHGYSGKIFMDDYGVQRHLLHFDIGHRVDVSIIDPMSGLRDLISASDLTHALITHGSYPYALRVLDHLGLAEWFPPSRVQGYENFDFKSKAENRLAFERAIEQLGCNANNVVMVEDTVRNLRVPHEMGIMTVWLTHGKPSPDAPRYVDLVCSDAVELLQITNGARVL